MGQDITNYVERIISGLDCRTKEKREIAEELTIHLQMLVQEYEEKGFDKEEAIARAIKEFGDAEMIKEGYQDTLLPDNKNIKKISWVLFSIYSVIGLWYLLFERIVYRLVNWGSFNRYFWYPDETSGFFSAEVWKLNTNIIPFKNTYQYIAAAENFNTNIILSNILGNIGIFIPLGIFLSFIFNRYKVLPKVMMVAFTVTVTIELLQFFLQLGQFDVDDIILNTAGAFLGYFIFLWTTTILGLIQSANSKKLQGKES